MRIEQVVQQEVSKVNRPSARAAENKREATGEARTADRVELSKSVELLRTARTGLDSIPEVRTEKIAQVMARVQEGFYNRPDVQAQTAVALTGSPALRGDIAEAQQIKEAREQMKATSETRTDRMAETKKRMSEGFYNTPEVKAAIANRVVEAVSGMRTS
jgi:anti-sigma28 factor (negative regulator of flagellin synthesis)